MCKRPIAQCVINVAKISSRTLNNSYFYENLVEDPFKT